MKLRFSIVVALLLAVTFTYTSCKKSSNSASGPALTPKQISSQIALNLTQTLYGGFGAFNLNGGLNAPGTLGLVHTKNGLKLNSTGDDLCGVIADTTLNYSTTDNGVSASVKGELKFTFACNGSQVLSGFSIFANLAVTEATADFSAAFKLNEDLTLTSQNPSNSDSNLVLSGSFGFDGSYTYKTGSKGSGTQAFNYNVPSIIIDSEGTIVSGSATFTTKGTGSTGVWNYAGSITFLGNGKATITINGTAYNVDLATGVVS